MTPQESHAMTQVTIKTNHQYRHTLDWYELTPREQKDFNYLDTEDAQCGAAFIRYRGYTYDLGQFMQVGDHAPRELAGWHGYHSDSYFSGIVVRFDDECERVMLGTYFS
jgi:hypothetical protein